MDEQKAKALDALRAASSTCSSALTILSGSPSSIADAPALSILRKDLIALLSLVYSQITKLALSLKPASPAYSASVAPAEDLSKHINAVATCTTLFNADVNGSTLVTQVRSTTREIIEAVDLFLQTVIATLGSDGSVQGQGKDVYLIRTGAVHELIEQARGPDGIPDSNVVAVKRRWVEDHRMLKDALQEFEDMMQPSMGDVLEDDFGDGWDELGLGKEPLTLEELGRVKAMHPLLRMISSLHKKVQLDLLSTASSRPMSEYDILVTQSSSLISHLDDFVASLYSPQQLENIASSLQLLLTHLDTLKGVLQPFIPDEPLEEAAAKLSLDPKKGTKNIAKWFATCFAQIQSLSLSARASIQIPQS